MIRRRFFSLHNEDTISGRDPYAVIVGLLGDAVSTWLGQSTVDPWPTTQVAVGAKSVVSSEIASEDDPTRRMVTADIRQDDGSRWWSLTIRIAAYGAGSVELLEELDALPSQARTLRESPPTLLTFLDRFNWVDADGRDAGVLSVVDPIHARGMAEFIRQGTLRRALPLVLISPTDARTFTIDPECLARDLAGVAHVMVLGAHWRWGAQGTPLLNHPCYAGSVRIYNAGYQDDDGARQHRFWRAMDAEKNPTGVYAQIIAAANDAFADMPWMSAGIVALERELAEEQRQRDFKAELARRREEFQGDSTAAFQLAEEENLKNSQLQNENERLSARVRFLELELSRRLDQIRQLKYRANREWEQTQESDEEATYAEEATARLLLSAQAKRTLRSLDHSARTSIEKQILRKFDNPALVAAQSEAESGLGGSCFIYPRSDAANGSRAIYTRSGCEIRVLELYCSHDHYEQARDRGWVPSDYVEFDSWTPQAE